MATSSADAACEENIFQAVSFDIHLVQTHGTAMTWKIPIACLKSQEGLWKG
jgi:hypothetical protein